MQPSLRVAGGQPVQPPLQGNTGQPVQHRTHISLHMGKWRSVHLECLPIPLTR
jgi:hypothetical protein